MVLEYRVNWTGSGGLPGTSVFHGRGVTGAPASIAAQDLADRVHAAFVEWRGAVPDNVTFTFDAEVTDLNTTTGDLEAVHPVVPGGPLVGAGGGAYAAPAGARIEWRTQAIVNSRRLRGRTFIVPIAGAAFEDGGTLVEVYRTILGNGAAVMLDADVFADVVFSVWSRTHGIQADAVAADVPDEVAILRSRRD